MIYRMKLLTLVVSLFVLTKSAAGQESLIEIYQRALQNDPVIREAEANYLAMLEIKIPPPQKSLLRLKGGGDRSRSPPPFKPH